MIVVAVRWYLRFNLSYRDVEELLVEIRTESQTRPNPSPEDEGAGEEEEKGRKP